MLKYMLQFDIIPTSEFLYLITNHATDAIKAVVHTVNIKFRKLKKNNTRNTNKTRQLIQNSTPCESHFLSSRVSGAEVLSPSPQSRRSLRLTHRDSATTTGSVPELGIETRPLAPERLQSRRRRVE